MKKNIGLILILFSIYTFGQNENLKTKALTFSFNGLNLNQFYGGIGGKVWLDDYFSLNANIGFNSRNSSNAGNELRTDGKDRSKTILFGVGLEKHFQGLENIEPYWMGRIEGSYTDRDYDPSVPIEYQSWGNRTISRTISVESGMGVEYWVTDKISLAGQHLFRFYYTTGNSRDYETNSTQKIITRGFDTGTSSLILAIYF